MTSFIDCYSGRLESLLSWQEFDDFWQDLSNNNNTGWYIYKLGDDVPEQVANSSKLQQFLLDSSALLHQEHHNDYCGIVYVNDKAKPQLIKIYHPQNLGVSCGFSENPPLPHWVLSKLKPSEITPSKSHNSHWWNKFHIGT